MQSAHPGGAAFSGSEFLFLPSKTRGSLSPGCSLSPRRSSALGAPQSPGAPLPRALPCPPGIPLSPSAPLPWVLPCPGCSPIPWVLSCPCGLVVTHSDAADAAGDFCLGFQGLRASTPSQEAAPRPSYPGETELQEGWVSARLHDPRCAGEAVPPRLIVPSMQVHK